MKTKTTSPSNGHSAPVSSGRKRHTLHWSAADRKAITDKLNGLLANYQVHYQKLRNYHWNVKGGDFFDLHVELEAQYQEAQLNIDLIAERIRVFRERPLSCMSEYLEHSSIKEDTTVPAADHMVKNLLADYVALLDFAVEAAELAMELQDMGTEEMVKGFIKQVEKHHWMLSAFNAK
ncbi:MAG: DNA starvation/stationary phase protection protein [Flavobacteriales bacterium]|nr:DNA starvation/stationary phase protection protein [Flavobacteriales bacterium]